MDPFDYFNEVQLPGGLGGGTSLFTAVFPFKMFDFLSNILKQTLRGTKMVQDPVFWAWLEIIFDLKGSNSKNNTLINTYIVF